jgi:CYTH domain-containing protein
MTGIPPRETNPAAAGHAAMGMEIERKFLLRDTGIVAGISGRPLVQGYFADIDGWSVRLRTVADRNGKAQAWLTLKSQNAGAARREIEAAVDYDFAARLLGGLPPEHLISKIRYRLPLATSPAETALGGKPIFWEIDRFLERHHGLWLAEIELPRIDYPVVLPAWIGPEVTDDPRYRNTALARAAGPSPQSGGGLALPPPPAPAELAALVRGLLAETVARPDDGPAADGTAAHA